MEKSQIEQLRANVTQCMERYGEQLREAGMSEEAEQISQKITEFRNGLFQVLFTGVFSAGKSTTLNALMHQKLLFVSINPATPVITRIVNGEDSDHAVITFRDENKADETMTIQDFAQKYRLEVEDPEKFREIKYVTIQRKLPTETIIYADSPGLENTEIDSKIANEFAKKADATVFMLNATKAMGENDRKYVQDHFERRELSNVFFVVNWYNMVQPQEEEGFRKKVEFDLHDVFLDKEGRFNEKLFNSRVFYVDSFTSECARTGTPKQVKKGTKREEVPVPPEEDQYTGIPEFEEALYTFLQSSDKDKEGYRGYLPRMASMYKLTKQSVEEYAANSSKSLEELQAQRDAQQKVIVELTDTIDGIGRAFDNAIREIMVNMQSAYGMFITSVGNNWNAHFEQTEVRFGAGQMAKVIALKTKNKFQDLFGRSGGLTQQEIELVREKDFQEIMSPVSKAIEQYIESEVLKMNNQIEADSTETIERLGKEIEAYCRDISEMNMQGIDIRQILGNLVGSKNLDTSAVSGDFNLAQVLISSVLFYNVDDAVTDIVGGKQPWGAFLKKTLLKEMQDVMIASIIGLFTGVGWIYYIARFVWGMLTIKKQGGEQGRKIIIGSKEPTVQALVNERDKIAAEMEEKFAEKLHQNCVSFTREFKAQLEEKQEQLDKLIDDLNQEGFNREEKLAHLESVKEELVKIFNEISLMVAGRGYTEDQILEHAAGYSSTPES